MKDGGMWIWNSSVMVVNGFSAELTHRRLDEDLLNCQQHTQAEVGSVLIRIF
jgi:hypothetical protein